MATNIYDKIKALCDDQYITISKLESDLGFGNSSISKWRHNSSPSIDKIIRIAKYFNVSIEYLVGMDATPTPLFPELPDLENTLSKCGISSDRTDLLSRFCRCLADDNNSITFLQCVLSAIEACNEETPLDEEQYEGAFINSLITIMRTWKKRKRREREEYERLKQLAEDEDLF